MLKGSKSEDLSPLVRCLETREMPAVFLRLQSTREQIALPYSSLIRLELKNDETALELSYITHRVIVTGKNLAEIYRAVADAEARLIAVLTLDFPEEARGSWPDSLVREIRIDPLEPEERRRR